VIFAIGFPPDTALPLATFGSVGVRGNGKSEETVSAEPYSGVTQRTQPKVTAV
jgi:hypothetical protein